MMDYIVLEEPSSSTSYIGSGDDGGASGGRAIDRHNPIIRDEKRLNQGRSSPSSPIITSTTTTSTTPTHTAIMKGDDKKKKRVTIADAHADDDDNNEFIKTYDLISPASSSRCLLTEKAKFDFSWEIYHVPPLSPPHESPPPTPQPPPPPPPFDDLWFLDSDDDDSLTFSPPKPPPSPPLEPMNFLNSKVFNTKHHDSLSYTAPTPPSPPPPSPPPPSSDQVVVLEVSLHCRGCERKMKKHISKIEGVKSFKIEFAAKKVTVVGNVTPLAVLTSVLKVKNAKLLTPATMSSSPSQTCSHGSLQKSKF